jgi:hypothetical protein
VSPFTYKGVKYLRDDDNQTVYDLNSNEVGLWNGTDIEFGELE